MTVPFALVLLPSSGLNHRHYIIHRGRKKKTRMLFPTRLSVAFWDFQHDAVLSGSGPRHKGIRDQSIWGAVGAEATATLLSKNLLEPHPTP